MQREQVSLVVLGLAIGFVGGFIVAFGLYGPGPATEVAHAAASPAAAPAPTPTPTNAAPPTNPMDQVKRQIDAYKGRLETDPTDRDARLGLADMYMQAAMFDQAAGFLEEGLEHTPDDPEILSGIGYCYARMGNWPTSLEYFERSAEVSPDMWQTWFYIASIRWEMGDADPARQALLRAEQLNPTSPEVQQLRQQLAASPQG